MRRAVEFKEFDGIEIGRNKMLISHLQFANDITLLRDALLKNAKCLKGILPVIRDCVGVEGKFS